MLVEVPSDFDFPIEVVLQFLNHQHSNAFLVERRAGFAVESADLLGGVVGVVLLSPPIIASVVVVS